MRLAQSRVARGYQAPGRVVPAQLVNYGYSAESSSLIRKNSSSFRGLP